MLKMKLVSLAVLFLLLAATPLRTAFAECPNTSASQVDVEFQAHGELKTCGLGFVIFGIGGAILGENCPEHETRVPAHQECRGAENAGTKCSKDTDLAVETRECACGGLVIPGIRIGIPTTCSCEGWYKSGTVEDFRTERCDGPDGL